MDWRSGFGWQVRCFAVDRATWCDAGEIAVTGGTIDRQADGTLESASLELAEALESETLLRIYLEARQSGESERVPLFTGLATSPSRDIDGIESYSAECASVLQIPADVLLPLGYYVPAGMPAATLAARLVGVFGVRVEVEDGSPPIADYLVAEDGDTNLDMAWSLLESVGWTMTVDGCGTVAIAPAEDSASERFDALDNDVIEVSVTDEQDAFDVPNRLRVTSGDTTVEVSDDDPDSKFSTVSRGREVWTSESDPALSESETLEGYARRRLAALQQTARSLSYSRRFSPDARPGSVVEFAYPGAGLAGAFRVTSQRIDLGSPYSIEEEAEC